MNEATERDQEREKELLQTIMTEVRFDMNLQKQIKTTYKGRAEGRSIQSPEPNTEYMNKEQALIIVVAVVFLAAGYILCKIIS